MLEGDLTLRVWGAYTWRGLFLEFYSILRIPVAYIKYNKMSL